MSKWEYCEIEVVYKGSGAEAIMFYLKADGQHTQSTGRYGDMVALLGEQGWEMVSVTGVGARGDPLLKMFFTRPINEIS
jgi:hypothetical protein